MKLSKKYKVYLMQHSHTDIGYTKSPETTINEQVEYIYFLIDKLADPNNEYKGYKWICESYVIVEKFLEQANETQKQDFINLINRGVIEVTGMYANLSEVIDSQILGNMIKKASTFASENNLKIESAMNADINGLSRDYGKQLCKNGIKNYFIAVHTHHGMYPLFEKQKPFKWDLGDGDELTVWNGEHYMFGNGFAFSKGAISVHGFFDDVDFKKYNMANDDSWLELGESRFEKYINKLEEDGYEYDFIPLTIHGKFTDNSMPNLDIINRVNKWNEKNSEQIEVVMSTLSEFFDDNCNELELDTYTGEWPDWWTDGVISAPGQAKLFKNAQSQYNRIVKLDKTEDNATLKADIEHNLVMYAEHTFGSFDSISNPYHGFTHKQWALKQNYLSTAMRLIDRFEHNVLKTQGKVVSNFETPNCFKVINTEDVDTTVQITIPFDNSDADNLNGLYQISDSNHKNYDYAVTNDWRKFPIIDIELKPYEQLNIFVQQSTEPAKMIEPYFGRINRRGSDNVYDVNSNSRFLKMANTIKADNFQMSWNENGIISIIKDSEEILRNGDGLLQPIYEVSDVPRDQLGRNRKGYDVIRSIGRLVWSKYINETSLFVEIEQKYELNGFGDYKLFIKIPTNCNYVEFKVQCDKQLSPKIENVYLNLPFKNEDIKIAKSNSIFTPWQDQLPGTLVDYFSVFDGIAFGNYALSTPDVQLLQLGSIEPQDRLLYGNKHLKEYPKQPRIWLMSNYWETNFVKSLAGFYEFNFKLSLIADNDNLESAIKAASMQPIMFPVSKQDKSS